jgi:multidrug efflux pump subunit AcrA (membrane-fusion protein)
LKIRAPDSESFCLLYDLEVSLLRLMNGKRDLDAIVTDGKTAGLPITRESLEKFLRELAAYQFLDNADPLPSWKDSPSAGEDATREDSPDESTPDEAASDEAGSEEAASDESSSDESASDEAASDEAASDEAASDEAASDESTPDESAKTVVGAPAPSPTAEDAEPGGTAPLFSALASRSASESSPPSSGQDASGQEWQQFSTAHPVILGGRGGLLSSILDSAPAVLERFRGPKFLRAAGLVGLALLLGGAWTALRPRHVEQACRLVSLQTINVVAPAAGSIRDALVSDGYRVHKGDVLLRYDGSELQSRLDELDRKIRQGEHALALMKQGADPSQLASERRRLAEKGTELAKLRRQVAKAQKRHGTHGVQQRQEQLEDQYSALKDELDLMNKGRSSENLDHEEAMLASASKWRADVQRELGTLTIRAPADGVITGLVSPLALHSVHPGDLVLQIASSESVGAIFKLPADGRAARLKGVDATFVSSGGQAITAQGRVVDVLSDSQVGQVQVRVELDNAGKNLDLGMDGQMRWTVPGVL